METHIFLTFDKSLILEQFVNFYRVIDKKVLPNYS